jgi:serine/threonine-protein kinase
VRDLVTSSFLGTVVDGRYRLTRLAGQGAMGSVFEAEHTFTGERVAIKLLTVSTLTAEAVARLRREAKVLAALRSPYTARILDAGVAIHGDAPPRELPFLVMELLEGESLSDRLTGGGAQAPADVTRWMGHTAAALAEAHALGIVHRDVKPGNVFLARSASGEETARLLDFGVAQVVDATSYTLPGMLLGTPRYMAPEQARAGAEPIEPSADLYALAMLTFTLLAGASYRRGTTMEQVLSEAILEAVVAPSRRGLDYGPAFDAWFLRACASEPAARFRDATSQQEALAAALEGAVRRVVSPDVTADEHPAPNVAGLATVREIPARAASKRGAWVVVGALAVATMTAIAVSIRAAGRSDAEPAPIAPTPPSAGPVESPSPVAEASAVASVAPSASASPSAVPATSARAPARTPSRPPAPVVKPTADPFAGPRF